MTEPTATDLPTFWAKHGLDAADGHGHVRPRKDGLRARCGGTVLCSVCRAEERLVKERGAEA